MPSTRGRRGLAAAAVTALTLTGLAAGAPSPASAAAADPDLRLMSPYNAERQITFARERFQDSNGAVRLAAEAPAQDATVTFEWNATPTAADDDAGWTAIPDPVRRTGRYVSVDWTATDQTPPNDAVVALRVVSTTSTGEVSYSTMREVPVSGEDNGYAPAVRFDEPERLGFFPQPYGDSERTGRLSTVSGVTEVTEGSVQLSAWRSETGTFQGIRQAGVVRDPTKEPDDSFAGGEFSTVLDLRPFKPADGRVVALGAELGSDHVWPAELYRQQVQEIRSDVRPGRRGEDTETRLSVVDQEGAAVAGVEVFRAATGSGAATRVGYTDRDGGLTVAQRTGSTRTYYANVTDADGFDEGVDPTTGPVLAPAYDPVATELRSFFADGDAFDVDEFALGDIALDVLDQQGRPLAGAEVEYRVRSTEGDQPEVPYTTATSDEDGRAIVDPQGFAGPRYGNYAALEYRFPGATETEVESFEVGQARIVLERDPEGAVGSGGTASWRGRLQLGADGIGLRGRAVAVDLRRGIENVPGSGADAGIVTDDGLVLSQRVVTDDYGFFVVDVKDPAERGRPAELGGRLTASTADNVPDADSTLSGNAGARARDQVDFGSGKGSVTLGRSGAGNGARADELTVTGPASVAGETVRFLKVGRNGGTTQLATRRLDGKGDRTVSLEDTNGTRTTTYVVELVESSRVQPAQTDPITLR
jgi:hypothetical protein